MPIGMVAVGCRYQAGGSEGAAMGDIYVVVFGVWIMVCLSEGSSERNRWTKMVCDKKKHESSGAKFPRRLYLMS